MNIEYLLKNYSTRQISPQYKDVTKDSISIDTRT